MDGLARVGEDRAVDANQVASFHAFASRNTADAHYKVAASKRIFQVIAIDFDHIGQRRKSTVIELHVHAVQGAHRLGKFDQVQDHRLIGAEHFAASKTEVECISDLSGCTCNSYSNGFHHDISPYVSFRD